jgi:integrase
VRSASERRIKLYRGVWSVVWTERAGNKTVTRRESLRTGDRAQAERNFQEYLRQSKGQSGSISFILDQWAEDKKHLSSIEPAKRKFKPLKEFFGNLLPDQVTRELCREYTEKRDAKNNTIRNELALLRAAINWHNPNNLSVFELPVSDPPKDHFLTPKEYGRLLKHATAYHINLFIIVAFHTGARSNAVLDLTWDRVNFEKKLINLSKGAQNNKRRALVPINKTLEKHLIKAYKGRTTDYVIEYGGKQVKSVRKGFGETSKRAGVQASPHILRHTAAMVMAEDRVPLMEIEQFLGHTGGSTTQRVYARYSPTYLQLAASALHKWHLKAIRATGSK